MSIRPWVVVEAPDRRGLRRVTVGGDTVGSAWSLRQLRTMLDRLGYRDVDVEDPASVCWRGGDSGAWPDRAWRRRATLVVMMAGLLASAAFTALIGWPDASGAQTFAQRITGALLALFGVVQFAAAVFAPDYWGRRQFAFSGTIILIGAFTALATDSLLVAMWLQEREPTPYMLAFMPLWCWSLWALYVLVREKSWEGIPQPKKFAAGVLASAVFSIVSLAYSTIYQPTVAPLRFALKADFGTARPDRRLPFVHVPLKLSVKNTGEVPVYVIIDDFTVYGRTAKYSEKGESVLQGWKDSYVRGHPLDEEADRHVDQLGFVAISSGRLYEPGTVLDSGQEDILTHVFQIPKNVAYDLLRVNLQITYMRKDRGRIDVESFGQPHPTWLKRTPDYCHPAKCPARLLYRGRVRHDNNLVNVTRKPRYVGAQWSPTKGPQYSISSYDSAGSSVEETRDEGRYGISTVVASSEVSVAELLKSIPSPSPS
ncbi:Yip1 family protein [Streptomyces sp. NPDC007251]|uniref:Yip1 family protein n=1 Tax=unclassified Streptomyces TaxID=2593676 RepID=UPI00340BC37A